jgi:hypothetical protein
MPWLNLFIRPYAAEKNAKFTFDPKKLFIESNYPFKTVFLYIYDIS